MKVHSEDPENITLSYEIYTAVELSKSVPQVREEQIVRICLYVHVCVALPMIVSACGQW